VQKQTVRNSESHIERKARLDKHMNELKNSHHSQSEKKHKMHDFKLSEHAQAQEERINAYKKMVEENGGQSNVHTDHVRHGRKEKAKHPHPKIDVDAKVPRERSPRHERKHQESKKSQESKKHH